jgi:hypothetical protein
MKTYIWESTVPSQGIDVGYISGIITRKGRVGWNFIKENPNWSVRRSPIGKSQDILLDNCGGS